MTSRSSRTGWLVWALFLGTLAITGPSAMAQENAGNASTLITRVYDVADLLLTIPTEPKRDDRPEGASSRSGGADPKSLALELIKLITETVSTSEWMEVGGAGTARVSPVGLQLVINQTPSVHESITALLAQLREAQKTQITVECLFVSVDPDELPKEVRKQLAGSMSKENATLGAYLSAEQAREIIKASHDVSGSALVMTPRVTMFNGATAETMSFSSVQYIQSYSAEAGPTGTLYRPTLAEVEAGVKLSVCANASADKKHVALKTRVQLTSLASLDAEPWPGNEAAGQKLIIQKPQVTKCELESLASVPDRQTLLIGGLAEMTKGHSGLVFRKPVVGEEKADRDEKWVPIYMLVSPAIISR